MFLDVLLTLDTAISALGVLVLWNIAKSLQALVRK
jgi:hypothetical protein